MDVNCGHAIATVFRPQHDDDLEKRQNATETKTDLKLLLQCLKCHMNDATVQRDSLLTIAAMCSGSEEAQEIFRESGGINFVLNLLTSSVEDAVRIAALYMLGCACEKNVFSQKRLCTKAVFKFLYCQLKSSDTDNSLKRVAAFLILCLVTNNGEGQNLARTSKCLDVILKLFRTSHPLTVRSKPGEMWLETHTNNDQLELWISITSTLGGCVNNPQNEENQQLCATAFPTAVTLLSKTKNPRVMRLLSSFLSLTVANHVGNQDRFGILGGLEILVSLLQGVIESLLREPERDYVQAALQLANLFVSCITDSDPNHSRLVNLNLVPLLVQLLSMEFIDLDVKLKVIVTLGHLTEKSETSQRQLLESDGLGLLVHIMTENQDEEFHKAAMYLLSTCVNIVSCLEGECNTNNEKPLTRKKQKTTEKRDSARVDRASLYGAMHSKRTSWTQQDLNAGIRSLDRNKAGTRVDGVHTANVVAATSNDELSSPSHSQRVDAEVIDFLHRQLQEERRKREQLEIEKEEIQRQAKIKTNTQDVINEKAEAITRELERQYKEHQHEKHEDKQKQVLAMETPAKLSVPCSMNDLEQKVAALEKTIHSITKIGDGSISTDQVKKQINSQQSVPQTMNKSSKKSDSYKVVPDGVPRRDCDGMCDGSKDSHNMMAVMTSGDLQESVNRHRASDQNNDLVGSAGPHNKESQNKDHKSASTGKDNVFRVPTAPVPRLRQANRASRKDETPPSLNDIKCFFKPSHTHTHEESDRESHTSDTTYQSTAMSFTTSDMALFQPRVQLVDIMHSGNPTHQRQVLSAQRGNHSFKTKHTVHDVSSLSRPVSELTQPKVRQNSASKDNRSSSKNVFTSSGSQGDLSGKSSSACSTQMTLHRLLKCPGCAPPVHRPLLNSRNFLYTLERSSHTCSEHRDLQRAVKHDIQQRKNQEHNSSPESVRHSSSTLSRNVRSALRTKRFPHAISSTLPESLDGRFRHETAKCSSPSSSETSSKRRKRQNFTEQEIKNLIDGVAKKGKHWNAILWGYEFQPGRTSVDLKDKYKRMQANSVGVIKSSGQTPSLSGKSRRQYTDPTWDPTWHP